MFVSDDPVIVHGGNGEGTRMEWRVRHALVMHSFLVMHSSQFMHSAWPFILGLLSAQIRDRMLNIIKGKSGKVIRETVPNILTSSPFIVHKKKMSTEGG